MLFFWLFKHFVQYVGKYVSIFLVVPLSFALVLLAIILITLVLQFKQFQLTDKAFLILIYFISALFSFNFN